MIKAHFPTFIYYEDLQKGSSKKLNRELLDDAHKIRKADHKGKKWCEKNYPGGYTSYASYAQLHQMSSTFMDLEKAIRKHVVRFAKFLEMDIDAKRIFMTDCWVNMMPKQVMHGLHLHPLSFISGTYYVKTPPNCSRIKFEDPRLSKFMAAPPKKTPHSEKNEQHISYQAKEGKLVLFESWLRHEVAANPTDEERVSVSFNYGWS